MNFEEYAGIKAMNWSTLVAMGDGAAAFYYRREHPRKQTTALSLGTAAHKAILTPAEFERDVATKPAGLNLTTKAGIAWKAANEGRTILSADDGEAIKAIMANLERHEDASNVLRDTDREVVVTWTDEETGVACKARFDAVGQGRLVELKSTRSLKWFKKDVITYRYLGQLAWYLAGAVARRILPPDARVYIVAVQTTQPFGVAAFRVQPYQLASGHVMGRRFLNEWLECERCGVWPDLYPALCDLEVDEYGLEPDEEEVAP